MKSFALELLTEDKGFAGIGRVWIGRVQVRSGRLPWRPVTATWDGRELAALRLVKVGQTPAA
jgi:hypothetical protein